MRNRCPASGRLPSVSTLAAAALLPCLQLLGSIPAGAQQAPRLPPLPTAALPGVVARVDDGPISRRELIAQAQSMRIQSVQAGTGDPGQSEQFLPMVLEALISERLVYADSKTRGVGPSADEIEQRVQAVIESYGGEEKFDKTLADQGLDRRFVRQQVTQTLSFTKVMESEIKPVIAVSEEAIQTYYERYKDQMRLPAYYKIRHIMKQVPEAAGAEARQAARSTLEAVRQQVEGGADLAALAKEHSDDARTRDQGGGMPWIVLTGSDPDFEPAVAALSVGELSGIGATRVGLHLIRLEERKPERLKTLEEARQEITNLLAAVEARRESQRRVTGLRSAAKIEILM